VNIIVNNDSKEQNKQATATSMVCLLTVKAAKAQKTGKNSKAKRVNETMLAENMKKSVNMHVNNV